MLIFVIVFFNVDQITWFNHSEKENLQDEDSENEQAMLDRQTFISEEEIEEKDNFEHLEAEDLENTEPLEEEDKTETNSWKVTHSKKPNPPAKKTQRNRLSRSKTPQKTVLWKQKIHWQKIIL